MIISKSNSDFINSDLYVHDDILLNITFNRNNKVMILTFEKYASEGETYNIRFLDVIGFEMTSADYFQQSIHTNGVHYCSGDELLLIPKLKKKENTFSFRPPLSYDDYIEVVFEFASADELIIASKQVEIDAKYFELQKYDS